MGIPDQVSYGRAARFRVALSAQASGLADSARGLVPTYADGLAPGGEFVESAARIARDARQLLELAVAYERRRGASWDVIGEALGISRQAAYDRFGEAARRLDAELVRCWLLGDDPRYPGLPYGVADPAEAAGILDRWVTRHLQAGDPLGGRPGDDPGRQRPVSHNLPPMDALEISALVVAATDLLRERWGGLPDGQERADDETRALEVGLARRKVEMYERMLAETSDDKILGVSDADTLRDLLAGARARLAELEGPGRS